jgi:hypothetical protein
MYPWRSLSAGWFLVVLAAGVALYVAALAVLEWIAHGLPVVPH